MADYSVISILNSAHSIGEGFLSFRDNETVKCAVVCLQGISRGCHGIPVDGRIVYVGYQGQCQGMARGFFSSACSQCKGARRYRRDARARQHTVNSRECSGVTDAAIVHLRGIHTLDMFACNQVTITDAAFVYLRGIKSLDMWNCNQATITDAAFVHLHGIQSRSMWGCIQAIITDAAFVHLRGIQKLDMRGCNQVTITGAAYVHLRGIRLLDTTGCSLAVQTAAAAVFAVGLAS